MALLPTTDPQSVRTVLSPSPTTLLTQPSLRRYCLEDAALLRPMPAWHRMPGFDLDPSSRIRLVRTLLPRAPRPYPCLYFGVVSAQE